MSDYYTKNLTAYDQFFFIKIDKDDKTMAEFAWESCRLYRQNKLDEKSVIEIEKTLEAYRKKVQSQNFIKTMSPGYLSSEVKMLNEIPVYSMSPSDTDDDEDESRIQIFQSLKKQSKSKKLNVSTDDLNNKVDDIARNQNKLENMLLDIMTHIKENSTVQNESGNSVDLVQIHKANKQMAETLKNTYELQVRNTNLIDLNWKDIPVKIRSYFTRSYKQIVMTLITAPITLPYHIVKNIVYEPILESYEYFSKAIRIIWGTCLIFFIIGGTLHIYYTTDWSYIQSLVDNPIINGFIKYIRYPIDKTIENLPENMLSKVKDAYIQAFSSIFGDFKIYLTNLGSWAWDKSTKSLSDISNFISNVVIERIQSSLKFW